MHSLYFRVQLLSNFSLVFKQPIILEVAKEDEVEEIKLPVEESKDIRIERITHSRLAWNEGQVMDEEDEEKGQQPEIFKKK